MLSRTTYHDGAAVGPGGERTAAGRALAALSDRALISGILRFEENLALAAHDCGAITQPDRDAALSAVYSLRQRLHDEPDLVAEIAAAAAAGANPAIPVVAMLSGGAGIHVGATSQDAIDTALAMSLRTAHAAAAETIAQILALLKDLAQRHAQTPMMARTLGQQALPTTFGLVAAGWYQQVAGAAARLAAAVDALAVQYAGPAGTLAWPPKALAIHDALAKRCGLQSTPVVWHSNRQPLLDVAAGFAAVAGAVHKIAGDIVFLAASEIKEVAESTPGGSSAMAHKANPAAAIACDGYARRVPGYLATMVASLDCRLQRGTGSWHAEWGTLRDLAAATIAAAARLVASLEGMEVHTETMRANMWTEDGGPTNPRQLIDRILNEAERERT